MNEKAPRLLRYIVVAFAVLAALVVLFINNNLASLADWLYPGSAVWTHAALLGIEGVAFLWFWRGLFGGSKHLLLMDTDSPEKMREFSEELVRRMRKNPHIQKAGITREEGEDDDSYLVRCMAHLNSLADKEIEQNAKRIFLATALTQNGRIDALIVFVSLCRLVWRVSSVYNQRPHPREVASLYWAVTSTTFLALSIEELDIATEITVGFGETFHAILPAGVTASIPFAGKALHTFTKATIDGAANCYLALRAGIITRNAYAYGARKEERPSRAAVFKEAGVILFAMSNSLVDKLAHAVADNFSGAVKFAGVKTVQAGKGVAEGIGSSAGKLATGTVQAGKDIVEGMASGTVQAVHGTGRGIAFVGDKVFETVQDTGKGIATVSGMAAAAVHGAGRGAVHGVRDAGRAVRRAGRQTAEQMGKTVDAAAGGVWKVMRAPFRKKDADKK